MKKEYGKKKLPQKMTLNDEYEELFKLKPVTKDIWQHNKRFRSKKVKAIQKIIREDMTNDLIRVDSFNNKSRKKKV